MEIQMIPAGAIRPDPNNIRTVPATAEEDAELLASIRDRGILQPLRVRRDPEGKAEYVLVFGERRWRQAQEAGFTEVPCHVVDGTEADAELDQSAENMARAAMHPVDQWVALDRAMKRDLSLEDAAAAIGISRAQARRVRKLADIHPELLDLMREHGVPEEYSLATIAMAGHERQLAAVQNARRVNGGVFTWGDVVRACDRRRMLKRHAIFDTEKAGVHFEEDVFAEPDDDDRWTTPDVDGFLRAQAAALAEEAAKSNGRLEIVKFDNYQPKLPKGWSQDWKARDVPKRWKKDDPRKVFAAVVPAGFSRSGEVLRTVAAPKAAPLPHTPGEGVNGASTGPVHEPTPPARDPITKAGKKMIADMKGEALRDRLSVVAAYTDMLPLVLLAMTANNVSVSNGESFHDVRAKLVDENGQVRKLSTEQLDQLAADVIGRIIEFEHPTSFRHSGDVGEWIGASIGADEALPRFDTPEFLKTVSGDLLREAAEQQGLKPRGTSAAIREQLAGKAGGWKPTKFGAKGPSEWLARLDGSDDDEIEGEPENLAGPWDDGPIEDQMIRHSQHEPESGEARPDES